MPLKLIPPKPGRTPYWHCRGTHFGVAVERSTKTTEERVARSVVARWRKQIEAGTYEQPGQQQPVAAAEMTPPTFLSAAVAYMNAGGDRKYLDRIIERFGETPLANIDQIMLDDAAAKLYPRATAATRNRQFYTPVAAVVHHAGVTTQFKRPKGWRGNSSTAWLEHDQAFRLFVEADKIDAEFGLLLRTLLYTGMRLGEALRIKLGDLKLSDAMIYLPKTKNQEPRAVHLPPHLVAAFKAQPPRPRRPAKEDGRPLRDGEAGRSRLDAGVPFLARDPDSKLFRFHAGGAIRDMLKRAMKAAKLSFPRRQGGFHLFCHTYGTWMHRTGLDNYGLARTGRWKDPRSADRYRHTAPSAEARMANLLPVEERVIAGNENLADSKTATRAKSG